MNDNFKIIIPNSKEDFKKYYYLRWKILRKPYGQELGTEVDQFENSAYHQMIINLKKEVVAVGRVHFLSDSNNKNIAQIRYMAVDNIYTKFGLGTSILDSLELHARNNNINKIILNSRESANNFYIKNGYKKIKKTHILYNKIQHWLMEKEIN